MKVNSNTVSDLLSLLRFDFDNGSPKRTFEEPFRLELFSSDQMNRHGKTVAASHKVDKKLSSNQLLKRLDDNEKLLLEVRNLLADSIREGRTITPAAEWLLDNFYLLEEQIVIARKHLPKGYSETLPHLADGNSAGMPRVYDIVLEIISHSDGRVDVSNLTSFLASYQEVTALTLGELWAIPIMLRLAVIENIRRVAGKIAVDVIDNNVAEHWGEKMIDTLKTDPGNLILVIADMARSKPVLDSHFVASFTRKLQGKGPALALPISWLEQQLSAAGTNTNELILQENQKQAIDQVSVRNSIGTLRFISTTDWKEFVETLSKVEEILRQDTAGIYPLMDFSTRDRYRHVVEHLSKFSDTPEIDVAKQALNLTGTEENGTPTKKNHVGYYLVDKGLPRLEKLTRMRRSFRGNIEHSIQTHPLFFYLFSILILTAASFYGAFYILNNYGTYSWQLSVFLILLIFLACLQLSISLVNWLSTLVVKPQLLPRMDFGNEIPPEYRSLVVVPTLLANANYIEELFEGLEIRYLANREKNLHYALLTDFADATTRDMPGDEQLVALAKQRVEELNAKYKTPEQNTFFLFHRPRKWNAKEKRWMGYERKRGKLAALNAFLRTGETGEFSVVAGNIDVLSNIKYVITLDSDTQVPRESISKFIATMAHPLNHPVFDEKQKRITEGYGILQPRVEPIIPRSGTSLYLRMQGSLSGIDPYTRVSSDVYQDLFGEGSFIGKGIYDVDAFEKALNGVFPENRILSHDLLEGCYVRSGLLSDIHLYEETPSRYENDIKRHHRWVRGDWQIGAWILPFVANAKNKLTRNKLSLLSKWKIFDNLRRSLMSLVLTLLLVLGWTVLPFAWFWTAAVTVVILLPLMAAAGWQLINKPEDIALTAHFVEVGVSVRDFLLRFMFGLAVLPYEAWIYCDAISKTLWRLFFTRRKLLQWTPSAVSRTNSNGLLGSYIKMLIAPLLCLGCIYFMIVTEAEALYTASPILTLWFLAPALAWRLSKEQVDSKPDLSYNQEKFLNQSARKIWAFFEDFVSKEENWLPPDNFQEQPLPVIAHRTSPTNIGLALLANLAANDFGYIMGGELATRCKHTFETMHQLERYGGHFYNWYDTKSLTPLYPRYISTVDSGNLVGHLLTLRQGLARQAGLPLFSQKMYEGLAATVSVIRDISKGHDARQINRIVTVLEEALEDEPLLTVINKRLNELLFLANELSLYQADIEVLSKKWSLKLAAEVRRIGEELLAVAPWTALPPAPEKFKHLNFLNEVPSLNSIYELSNTVLAEIKNLDTEENTAEEREWLLKARESVLKGRAEAENRIKILNELCAECELFSEVDYSFLFNKATSLLRIGYNVEEQRKDESYYDLLASEARLGIFAGIAQGKLPQESWFALGRLLTKAGGEPILLSWSGSMFEYLMPQLVMPTYDNTLLEQTNRATVKRQISYGQQRHVPWGISESGYNMVDASSNYQYRAFGVPGLGLKRGLDEDIVIAPYASMLALMVTPAKACTNLQDMKRQGFEGEYGFYEAIDYTPGRLPRGASYSIVRSFMVHHQGMAFLSLAYVLRNKPMQQRFESDLRFNATLLLLQERIPRVTLFYAHTADIIETKMLASDVQVRSINNPNTKLPEIQLLSNGRYHLMITNSGGSYSRWRDLAVTRWREDGTRDNRGIFCYIKDVSTGNFWSNTYQPTLQTPKNYQAVFSEGHVEFRRSDFGIETKTEIVVSPEDDSELRRIKITNKSQSLKTLEVTSYAEVVMATQASDEAHASFSNLFVQTEYDEEQKTIFSTRRPRSENEQPPWMFHLMDISGAEVEKTSFETDRMKFTGRGRTLKNPQAMEEEDLSGQQGSVLDPIMAIRYRFSLKANQTVTIDLIYGIAETKEYCEAMMIKYQDRHLRNRAFELSWTHSQVLLRQINSTESEAQLYNRLAASVIFANSGLRADPAVIQNNFRGQSGLWSHSVSGDLPIVLLHIFDPENIDLVKQLVQAHAYWRLKGLAVDLVIWNEDHGSYRQFLQDQILGLITAEISNSQLHPKSGSVFVKSADQLSSEDRLLFESVARLIISDNAGTLAEQVNKQAVDKPLAALLEVAGIADAEQDKGLEITKDLLFFNGTGGFSKSGKEYKIFIDKQNNTPAPWVNVIANPTLGTVLSESGSAYTWAVNAHEYRLTPWSNDPVSDVGGEAFYLRDERTGKFWSPCPFPKKSDLPYVVTHGFGYTTFEHIENGILSEMTVFADKELPVKFVVLKVKNRSQRERKLSTMGFLEIVLGDLRSKTNMHILSEQDRKTGTLLFRNRYNSAFAERMAFFKVDGGYNFSYTADRTEFIGRNGSLDNPQALYRNKLSGRVGAALDSCAALHVKFDLLAGEEKEIIFLIGSETSADNALSLVDKFKSKELVLQSLEEVKHYWTEIIDAVQIDTPDNALNIFANGWLVYQTVSSRMFGRSGFYQSGGAFGFRDQLQDVLALLHTKPDLAKQQILLSASRQFTEGDVQHWWHPPEGRGVRTRCSDDMLWLPYVVARYLSVTSDKDILDIPVGFLDSRTLYEGEESLYDLPVSLNVTGSLYEHCVRAIQYSFRFGVHGLPLIGAGDWNDGMDQVGHKGKGESVWLAFFLYDILIKFSAVALSRQDISFKQTCLDEAEKLRGNIEASGWDGEWYRRAYFDDGTPLGSKDNTECRIDAIAQSWAVLSGAADDERKKLAMQSLNKKLVRRDLNLIQLLDPPFDAKGPNPGYIRGYVPGVRENGGQYSHAAIWTLMAFASLGDRDRVWELFSMVLPVNHTSTEQKMQVYKTEPYVMAADVYANESHKGRGGWTWYTGSAGWMYQFILGSLVGMELHSEKLVFNPCFPSNWRSVTVTYKFKTSKYIITVFQDHKGVKQNIVDLVDDGTEHHVNVYS